MKNLILQLKYKIQNIIYKIKIFIYKRQYSDYVDNAYNAGSLKFIWGIKSYDCLVSQPANLYTMNDIDVTYDRKSKLYMLGIETAYMFECDKKQGECEYLRNLLKAFTQFMEENGYDTNYEYEMFFGTPTISTSAESIEELYTNFKIFVEGFCNVYDNKNEKVIMNEYRKSEIETVEECLQKIGITVKDEDGDFRPFNEVMIDLGSAFKKKWEIIWIKKEFDSLKDSTLENVCGVRYKNEFM